ncbi:hypothetical protein PR003_g5860 [Phytophthora rubi]|uniref:Uncharacterized protein n=1 Tax=Phytophthora rubi TaxID=129364 RepID=A0A6A4FSA6_9STRA|nr:hypothetical protein PR002_g9944 [Phytophthora rubi]KAE9349475.1 hypothetical protein PR003_g5860 [Phytophthora rubi]
MRRVLAGTSDAGSAPRSAFLTCLEEERKEAIEVRRSGYEAVMRSPAAVQSALTALATMKEAGADEELVIQTKQRVDIFVKRWMSEMDSM